MTAVVSFDQERCKGCELLTVCPSISCHGADINSKATPHITICRVHRIEAAPRSARLVLPSKKRNWEDF